MDVLLTMNVLLVRLVGTDNVSTLASLTSLAVHQQFAQCEITSQHALVHQDLREIHIVNVTRSRKENVSTIVNVLTIMLVSKISVSTHVV